MIYCNARAGTSTLDLATPGEDLRPLFDAIIEHIPPPHGSLDHPLQMLIANLDSSDYLGRIAIGRIFNGRVKINDMVAVAKLEGKLQQTRVTKLFAFEGLKRVDIAEAAAGDIVCLAGIEDITIGETVTDPRQPDADHADCRRRADRVDDLRRQHVAARRPRGPVRHVAQPARSARRAS